MLLNFPSHGVSLLGAKKRCKFTQIILILQTIAAPISSLSAAHEKKAPKPHRLRRFLYKFSRGEKTEHARKRD